MQKAQKTCTVRLTNPSPATPYNAVMQRKFLQTGGQMFPTVKIPLMQVAYQQEAKGMESLKK